MNEISPELVLVDPELAAQARALLPDPAPAAPVERPERRPPKRRRTARGRVAVPVIAGALGVTAGAVFGFVPRVEDKPSLAPSPAPTPLAQPRSRSAAAPPAARRQATPQPQAQRSARPAPPAARRRPQPAPVPAPKRSAQPAPPATVRGTKPAKPPPVRKVPGAGRPARVYRWAPIEGAVFYHVAFVRNGKPFHAAQTAASLLRVPDGLKFPPGTYRWSVRPAIVGDSGIVVGEPVLERTFRVGGG